eukprot:9415374-Lingulodinium_polyedra.AAC.1
MEQRLDGPTSDEGRCGLRPLDDGGAGSGDRRRLGAGRRQLARPLGAAAPVARECLGAVGALLEAGLDLVERGQGCAEGV